MEPTLARQPADPCQQLQTVGVFPLRIAIGKMDAEIAFTQRRSELAVVAAAARLGRSARLERAARELLALQSSDWAFQVTRDRAGPYPQERVAGHAASLHAALTGPTDPDPRVRQSLIQDSTTE